jgi:hypothetical protein
MRERAEAVETAGDGQRARQHRAKAAVLMRGRHEGKIEDEDDKLSDLGAFYCGPKEDSRIRERVV